MYAPGIVAPLTTLATLSVHVAAVTNCTRNVLQLAATDYLSAAVAGRPPSLTAVVNFTYTENNVTVDVHKGILARPIAIDFNRTFFDTVACAAFIEFNAASNETPYVVLARVFARATAAVTSSATIVGIDSIVTKPGDWAFDAASELAADRRETWDPIPAGQRDTRAVLQAAAAAYLDSWGNGSIKPPFGDPCSRIEGGISTVSGGGSGGGNTCHMPEFPQPFKVMHRRYLMDPEFGAVDIFNDFPFIDKAKPNGTPSTNLFRIEGGKIRYIHELTVCTTKHCGR